MNRMTNDLGTYPYQGELEELTDNCHTFLRDSGVLTSHRDLKKFLTHYRVRGKEYCYIYTGRGPSTDNMHIGHILPFTVAQKLQKYLQIPVVILLTDDEKFLYRKQHDLPQYTEFAAANIAQIKKLGFDPSLTYYYTGTTDIAQFYPTILKIGQRITYNELRSCFGFNDSMSVSKISFPTYQMAPCDSRSIWSDQEAKYCLVICAADQDDYFRLIRDRAKKLGFFKPALLHVNYLPSLSGKGKMSSSNVDIYGSVLIDPRKHERSVIWLNDDPETIYDKVRRIPSNSEQPTADLSVQIIQKLGNNSNQDTVNKYCNKEIGSADLKAYLTELLVSLLEPFRS